MAVSRLQVYLLVVAVPRSTDKVRAALAPIYGYSGEGLSLSTGTFTGQCYSYSITKLHNLLLFVVTSNVFVTF
jgi:hypothetical protein